MTPEEQLLNLNLSLPPAPPLGGVYKPVVINGKTAYFSGHGPMTDDGKTYLTGRLGEDMDVAAGQAAARQVGLTLLSTMKAQLGSLNRVKQIVKTLAFVNSTDDFCDQPQVINGYSELMAEVFGAEVGIGARSAIGTSVLPGNIPVEIEVIVELVD